MQQKPSPLVSLVLLGLRAGVHSNLAHNLHDDMIMRGIAISRTSDDVVEMLLYAVIQARLILPLKGKNPTRNRFKATQLTVISWLS